MASKVVLKLFGYVMYFLPSSDKFSAREKSCVPEADIITSAIMAMVKGTDESRDGQLNDDESVSNCTSSAESLATA